MPVQTHSDWLKTLLGRARHARKGILALLMCLLACSATADQHVPLYLQFSGRQCEPWTAETEPRREIMSDWTGRPLFDEDNPYRFDDTVQLIVHGTRYDIPLGHQQGKGNRAFYEDAVRGDGVEMIGIFGLTFWMPSLRYPERTGCYYGRCCEPGRPIPPADHYLVSADIVPSGSDMASERRFERLRWLERTETALRARLDDVLAGLVSEHRDRLVADVTGAIIYDGLFWNGLEERDPKKDWLKSNFLMLQSEKLFAYVRCTSVTAAASLRRKAAPFERCEVRRIGPRDPDSPLPEMEYRLARRDLKDWEEVYWAAIELMESWRRRGP